MNRVSDDNNFGNAINIWGLVDTISDSKKFCFSACDMNYMMNNLCDGSIMGVCMWYRCSNIVLDASIWGYNSSEREGWGLQNYIVKLLRAKFIIFLLVMSVKNDMIWEIVNDSKTRREFRMKRDKENLLAISTKWLLIRECCYLVRESREMELWTTGAL